jgi:glycosyltransferase involved in cell wall biosynthesis
MSNISACIITLNEEHDLPRALRSVRNIADETVVVDCGSTDRTQEIARDFGARLLVHEWSDYASQKNFAAQAALHAWILSLDADEELSPELQKSLLAWKQQDPKYDVYEITRSPWYMGGWIRHSGWYPDYQRRLYMRDAAQFSGIVHESLCFQGKPGRLSGDLFQEKVNRYSTLAAQQMHAAGKRKWRSAFYLAAPWSWFRCYVLRGGFLDGYRGFLIAKMACRTVRLKYQKLGQILMTQKKELDYK